MADNTPEVIEIDEETLAEELDAIVPLSDNEIEERYTNLSFRVIYQSNNFFLPQIRDLIKNREVINLRPEYQRRLRWSRQTKITTNQNPFSSISRFLPYFCMRAILLDM